MGADNIKGNDAADVLNAQSSVQNESLGEGIQTENNINSNNTNQMTDSEKLASLGVGLAGPEDMDEETELEIATLDELAKSIPTAKKIEPKQEEVAVETKPVESNSTPKVKKKFKLSRKARKIRNIVIFIAIVVFGIWLFAQYGAYKITQELTKSGTEAQMDSITRRDVSSTISTTGTIQSKDVRTVTSSLSNGTIEDVNVEVGDMVTKGDVVVTFSRENIDKKIANLQDDIGEASQAQALASKYQSASHNYDYLSATENNITANMNVTQAAENLAIAQADLDRACSEKSKAIRDYEEAVANKDSVKKEMDLVSNLYKVWGQLYRSKTTQEVYDSEEQFPDWIKADEDIIRYFAFLTTDTEWNNYISDLQKKYNEYTITIDNYDSTLSSRTSVVANAQAGVEHARQNYDSAVNNQNNTMTRGANSLTTSDYNYENNKLKASDQVTNLTRQMEEYEDSIDDYIVYAPISGIVTAVNAEEGNGFIASQGALLTIQDMDNFEVKTQIDEYDINRVVVGQRVVIMTDATGDDEFEGVVSFISPTATTASSSSVASSMAAASSSSSSATYEVDIDIINKDERIKLGMNAKLNIIIEQHSNVLAVRYDAIEENEDGSQVVYVVTDQKLKDDYQKKQKAQKDASKAKAEQSRADKKNGKTTEKEDKKDDDKEQTFIQYLFSDKDKKNPANATGTNLDSTTKEIIVNKGLEDDYYVEIISSEINDGDTVMINSNNGDMYDSFMRMMDAMSGGPGNGPQGGAW